MNYLEISLFSTDLSSFEVSKVEEFSIVVVEPTDVISVFPEPIY